MIMMPDGKEEEEEEAGGQILKRRLEDFSAKQRATQDILSVRSCPIADCR